MICTTMALVFLMSLILNVSHKTPSLNQILKVYSPYYTVYRIKTSWNIFRSRECNFSFLPSPFFLDSGICWEQRVSDSLSSCLAPFVWCFLYSSRIFVVNLTAVLEVALSQSLLS